MSKELLPFTPVTVKYVEYDNLEKFIRSHFGVTDFEFGDTGDYSNGDNVPVNIHPSDRLSKWDEQDISDWLDGKGYPPLHVLMLKLYLDGAIGDGDYLIRFDW